MCYKCLLDLGHSLTPRLATDVAREQDQATRLARQAANLADLGEFKASLATLDRALNRGRRLYPAEEAQLQHQRADVESQVAKEEARLQDKQRGEAMMEQGNYQGAAAALARSLGLDGLF